MRLARPAAVDIVDADTQAPAGAARGIMGEQRAIGVAEVERAGRAGRESGQHRRRNPPYRSEEHTSELQSLMRISYDVFCLKKTHRKITYKYEVPTTKLT